MSSNFDYDDRERKIQETLLYLKNNPKPYIEEFLKISIKKGQIIPFILNYVQNIVLNKILELKNQGKPIRIIILKARQTGISTLVSALIFHYVVFHPNVTAFIMAHDKNSTQNLFRIAKLFYDYLPLEYRPMTRYQNRYELTFENPDMKTRAINPGLRSSIRVETAGNPNALRGFTVQALHISELPFWERAEFVMTGIMQSVPNTPESMVFIEATANGASGYYYELWQDAVEEKNEWTPIFIPWFDLKEYSMEAPENFELTDFEHPNYGNEERIQKLYNLSMNQMYWRRFTIRNSHNNDLKRFNQEYPDSPETAFISTGNNVFEGQLIDKHKETIENPIVGDLVFVDEEVNKDSKDDSSNLTVNMLAKKTVKFIPNPKGKLSIFRMPEKENKYNIGADSSEGLTTSTDPSCAQVLDKKNKEQVAEFSAFLKPDEFAVELIKLGLFYNTAQIAVESNSHGLTVLYTLKVNAYPRIYHRRDLVAQGAAPTRQPGWKTTSKTKALMIDKLKQDMWEGDIILHSKMLLNEMTHYIEEVNVNTGRVKMNAAKTYNDDRVISLAIANITWDTMPYYVKDDIPVREWKVNLYTGY